MSKHWRWFARQALLRRTAVVGLLALTLITYAIAIAFPILTQHAVDGIVVHRSYVVFAGYLVAALLALSLEVYFSNMRHGLLVSLGTMLDERFSNQFFLNVLRLRADRKTPGASIGVSFQHVTRLRGFILSLMPRVVFDIGSALAALIAMAFYSAAVTAGTVVLLGCLSILMKRQVLDITTASKLQFEADGKRQSFLNETYNALETVKALAVEGRRYRQWHQLTRNFVDGITRVFVLGQQFALGSLVASRCVSLMVISIGCYQIGRGEITIGDLIALQLFAFRALVPLATLGDVARQYNEADHALRHISASIQANKERAITGRGQRSLPRRAALAFENVSLSYPGSSTPAVSDITFRTPAKGLVAIVGKNGAGKTTLINILLGFQRDYEGSVWLGGMEIRTIHPRVLRNAIGIASQEATLLSGTIFSNLDVGLSARTSSDMLAALRIAGAAVSETELSKEIFEAGRNLSGGQRQRIAIARSLIGSPSVIVLDEPTAFLDAEAARNLDQSLLRLADDRLLLMVSHNLSATKNASQIIVLKEGRTSEIGTHAQLLETSDEYRLLWEQHLSNLG